VEASELKLEIEGHSIGMSFSEQRNTKAAELDNSSNPISDIFVTAIEHENNSYYFKDSKVSVENGEGLTSHFWPKQNLSFFAYASSKEGTAPVPVFKIESSQYKGSFSYSLPSPTSAPQKDANAQPDLVFAITPDQSAGSSTTVGLIFHHALSALIFKTGNMPANTYLRSITISDVYSSGNCSMVASGEKDIVFSWDYTGKEQNATYTEEINENAVAGEQMGDAESTFMMLPQTMSDQTELSLSFSIEGREYTMVKKFKEIIPAWEADKKYVFTIGLPDEIDVEVEDKVEGVVKSDVKIQNKGILGGYVRASIIGYWVDNNGNITAPWKEEDGEFDWGENWGTHWKKGDDGFYYHLAAVAGKGETHPLFESYTLKTSTAIGTPYAFHKLELVIAAQIIPEDKKNEWQWPL